MATTPTEGTPRPSVDPAPETGEATPSDEPIWSARAKEGLAHLESLWRDVQKYQAAGYERARTGATDLAKSVSEALNDASVRFGKLATEMRQRANELAHKAQELLDRKTGTTDTDCAETAEPAASDAPTTPPSSN